MRQLAPYAVICLLAIAWAANGQAAEAPLQVQIGYLGYRPDPGPLLSNVIPEPADAGQRGAELAILDSNSTGAFLNQRYSLTTATVDTPDALLAAAQAQHAQGLRLFVVNAPAASLRQLSAALPDSLLFNAGSPDDSLRSTACLGNVLHTLPSRAMLADALAQFLVVRKWQKALLIVGPTEDDQAYAAALRRAAKRFGVQWVAEKAWRFDNDQRRSAQADMPLFTQTAEYDVVLVADERGDFGEYVPYQTWYPRPVAGTQGLTPTGWHKTVETYGAAQLQKRFEALAGRWMNDRDFAAWMAVRSIASAVSKLRQVEPMAIRQLEISEQLPLDGFKGRKLSYRPWNGQLRQPIPIVQPRALVSTSPQDGFLHPTNEMDSLGYDKPEVTCRFP
ncbi:MULTISPECIES: ABC transporter substrate-binding protein [Pseudomonas]|jgi:ABC transporter substrate binding protein (PQQ-dependent alcohol dehydrogenase system)|uniref:Branched-chain amino acid ABC transporter substrate-binding protein n=2 Tax=Pseudomonas simiae TaxID=321846 RepID=A0A1I0WBT6_9PSED|nr:MULTISPECIES: ABC transporter substrate-binding protein [Pseudomonas]MBD8738598.1 ABC transporter substrate-binding protein [Pseudomonas fluorescens]AJP53110.1 branched-chain amino acid ABC transporter substrate-binding protein [Pseudomonas simiae]AJZ95368.1 branched-chain amino acid ABC transporter substrate-binding protein [Pseudomonas simiae]ERH51926.1 branched-chain amino acid ABC transporter substrate-binding protein [Pseudomonas simiae]KIQ06708.1 branched-chain amino acid ABC transpor